MSPLLRVWQLTNPGLPGFSRFWGSKNGGFADVDPLPLQPRFRLMTAKTFPRESLAAITAAEARRAARFNTRSRNFPAGKFSSPIRRKAFEYLGPLKEESAMTRAQ